jgi:hypothetical protein
MISNYCLLFLLMRVNGGSGGGGTQERFHKTEKFVNPQKLFSPKF